MTAPRHASTSDRARPAQLRPEPRSAKLAAPAADQTRLPVWAQLAGSGPVLHGAIGPSASGQVLRRKADCGCTACRSGTSRGAGPVSDIRIGDAADVHEHEADRTAARVVGTADTGVAPDPAPLRVQRVTTTAADTSVAGHATAPAIVHDTLHAPGQGLDASALAFFEPRFGRDLSGVRVHTGGAAAESAHAVHAHAYTVGHHIVFATGRYQPGSSDGRRLLAHELTHVLQQDGAAGARTLQRDCDDPNFCKPYATAGEISTAQAVLRTVYLPLDGATFGLQTMGLFESFLDRHPGDSLAPVVFDDPASDLVDSFATSSSTDADQDAIIDLIGTRLSRAPGPLRDDTPTTMSIANFLSPAEMNNRPINYSNPLSIAGHIAGGIGSSDAGPDVRKVSGNVTLERVTLFGSALYVKVETTLHYDIFDSIDFCPGDCGSPAEQLVTIPMSRLEASGEAYDVPFEVLFVPDSRSKRFSV
ncbi:MAG: hypothetical protein JWM12_1535 [Ilumatobacteraceae bacterium]|nr:hypothetical protein [Ilumatobacteraceae bacterium]